MPVQLVSGLLIWLVVQVARHLGDGTSGGRWLHAATNRWFLLLPAAEVSAIISNHKFVALEQHWEEVDVGWRSVGAKESAAVGGLRVTGWLGLRQGVIYYVTIMISSLRSSLGSAPVVKISISSQMALSDAAVSPLLAPKACVRRFSP